MNHNVLTDWRTPSMQRRLLFLRQSRRFYRASVWSYLFVILACLALWLFAPPAHAGYAYHGTCYQDFATAQQAVMVSDPVFDTGSVYAVVGTWPNSANQLGVTYEVRSLSSGAVNYYNSALTFQNCDVTDPLFQSAQAKTALTADLALLVGCCLACFMGIRTGMAS